MSTNSQLLKPSTMKRALLLLPAIGLAAGLWAQCPSGQTQVTVSILTDNYGSETTWSLTGVGGTPVYGSGGPYGNNQQYNQNICVPDGHVLIFTIYDSYGDGICCSYGQGNYSVTAGGSTVVSGGQFGESQTTYFQTGPQASLDLAALPITMYHTVVQGNTNVTGQLRNFGSSTVTSFTLNYSVDGGAPVTQAVTANIAPNATYNFTHATPWNATVGNHTIRVWASNLNGSADGNPANDEAEKAIAVATQSVARTTVLEQFTSSTCGPCANLNVTFAPMLTSLSTNHQGSNYAAVKYHMNWPSPGNDPSYNPDGVTRKNYYGVTGIPDLYLDGGPMAGTSASVMQAGQAKPAFVSLSAQASVSGNQVTVNTTVTPYADFSGTHKLHIAVTENSYDYPASTTSQDQFHYVMRKMLPNAQGTTLAPLAVGQSQSNTASYTFTVGGPAQGNYNLWTNMQNLTVVAFVQNNSTKEVLQGAIASMTVGMDELDGDIRFGLYPNPTNSTLTLDFDMPEAGTARFEVYDRMGKLVHAQQMSAAPGATRGTMDLAHLENGLYHVALVVGDARSTRKVLVNK
jgi:hypothetical protein